MRALAACVCFLALAELLLQGLQTAAAERRGLPPDGPLCFCLGTSRVKNGLDPLVMEAALAAAGIERPFVANVSADAITNAGMLKLYLTELHPLLDGAGRSGLVAIEARPSGFNDSYFTDAERIAIANGEFRDLLADIEVQSSGGGLLEATARSLVGPLALFSGRESLALVRERIAGTAHLLPFATGSKGFVPHPGARHADLDAAFWSKHYAEHVLVDFAVGGHQTEALTRLVELVRRDGFEPVLFVMPVTAVHRSFWGPRQLDRAMQQIRDVAARASVPLFDFDSGHALPDEAFFDTHHLTPEAARSLSERFARDVLLPRLRVSGR